MNLLQQSPYDLMAGEKSPALVAELRALSEHHMHACPAYARLVSIQWPKFNIENQECALADIPWLSVRLFKKFALQSIPDDQIFKTLYSSGTTGMPSRIVLDADTAAVQSRILVKIMQQWLGKQRLPMLIIDCPSVVKDRANFSARGAGIQGLSFMGRNHCYALNDDMSLNWPAVTEFCKRFGDSPILIFGFTFMVWQHWLQQLITENKHLNLPEGILIHSGGWKKLEQFAVSNTVFKQQVKLWTGVKRVHNFYGMVEQVGAIFVECEKGYLHCPSYADVMVRAPGSWHLAQDGEEGVLQLLSTLPHSYPGHSLLTEDLGVIHGEDNCACGRQGKYFSVLGRLPKSEARGCSDTYQTAGVV